MNKNKSPIKSLSRLRSFHFSSRANHEKPLTYKLLLPKNQTLFILVASSQVLSTKMVEIQKICCFRLSSFAFIWGWLGTIFSGFGFVLGLVSLCNIEEIEGLVKHTQFVHYSKCLEYRSRLNLIGFL